MMICFDEPRRTLPGSADRFQGITFWVRFVGGSFWVNVEFNAVSERWPTTAGGLVTQP
jgi:hypothetical protein